MLRALELIAYFYLGLGFCVAAVVWRECIAHLVRDGEMTRKSAVLDLVLVILAWPLVVREMR